MELPKGCPAAGCRADHSAHSVRAHDRTPPELRVLGSHPLLWRQAGLIVWLLPGLRLEHQLCLLLRQC